MLQEYFHQHAQIAKIYLRLPTVSTILPVSALTSRYNSTCFPHQCIGGPNERGERRPGTPGTEISSSLSVRNLGMFVCHVPCRFGDGEISLSVMKIGSLPTIQTLQHQTLRRAINLVAFSGNSMPSHVCTIHYIFENQLTSKEYRICAKQQRRLLRQSPPQTWLEPFRLKWTIGDIQNRILSLVDESS